MAKTMTTDELKKAIAALSAVKQKRRYPAHLREEVLRHARARMAAGASRAAVCDELDVSEPTLMRFIEAEKPPAQLVPPTKPRFARVRVVERRPPAASTPLIVKGPCDLVVEGLTMAQLTALIRSLSCSA